MPVSDKKAHPLHAVSKKPVFPEFTDDEILSGDRIQKRLDEQAAARPGYIDHELRRKLLALNVYLSGL